MKRQIRDEPLEHGDRVEVYRNLHNNTFSVRLLRPRLGRGGHSSGLNPRWRLKGKVIKHLENWMTLNLQNVKFAVQPAGRDKVRREGKKNVHAFVRGTVIKAEDHNFTETFKEKCTQVIEYNPYHMEHFGGYILTGETDKKGRPCNAWNNIYKANLVTLTQGTVYASI